MGGTVNLQALREDGPTLPPEPDNDDGMSGDMDGESGNPTTIKADLMRIHKQAAAIYNMLGDADSVEEWIPNKLAKAAEAIASVFNHVEYEKSKPESLPQNGEALPNQSAY